MSEYIQRDPIGTVRLELHQTEDRGFSIWAKVGVSVWEEDLQMHRIAGSWVCVYSSAVGNPGLSLSSDVVEDEDNTEIIGTIPGTPAAQQGMNS